MSRTPGCFCYRGENWTLFSYDFFLGGGRWDAVGWGVLTFMRTALIGTHTLLGYVGWGWVGRVNFHMN